MPFLQQMLELTGAGHEWKNMPWQAWKPPGKVWKELPTFFMTEWGYRASSLAVLYHAMQTGRLRTWAAAWFCGTANDIFFMYMPFCDNFWQAQASVMITPRLPLYIVEMYVCVMYYPGVVANFFARNTGCGPLAEACLTGLLAHIYYGVYDVNGPRYLWWTWHDGDPSISERQANAPLGSSLWILTYVAMQSLLYSWIARGAGAHASGAPAPYPWPGSMSAVKALAPILGRLGKGRIADKLQVAATLLDRLQSFLGSSPNWVQILFRGVVCTPLFMTLMGQLQIFSLDKVGVPGRPTYRLTLALWIAAVVRGVRNGNKEVAAAGAAAAAATTPRVRALNRVFLGAILFHFGMHTAINIWGKPEKHVSTGIHQEVRKKPDQLVDVMGWPREEHLPPSGPHIYSGADYGFQPEPGVAKPDDAIDVTPDEEPANGWYSIYGKKHKSRQKELAVGALLAALGVTSFTSIMRKHV